MPLDPLSAPIRPRTASVITGKVIPWLVMRSWRGSMLKMRISRRVGLNMTVDAASGYHC